MTVFRGLSTSRRRTLLASIRGSVPQSSSMGRPYLCLPIMVIEPSHHDLDDVVQDLERDRGRHLDLTPDQRIGVPQLDANGRDLVEAVGCGVLPDRTHHAASLAAWAFQFQGSS